MSVENNLFQENIDDLCRYSDVERERLIEFLNFIEAPHHLKNLSAAISGCIKMLRVPAVEEFTSPKLLEYLSTAKKLLRAIHSQAELSGFIAENVAAKKLTRGMLQSFPLYSLLFFAPEDRTFVLHQLKQVAWLKTSEVSANDIDDYCRFVRILSENPIPQILKEQLEHPTLSTELVYLAVNRFLECQNEEFVHVDDYGRNLFTNTKSALRFLKVITNRPVTRRKRIGEKKVIEKRLSLGIRGYASLGDKYFVYPLTFRDEFDENFVPHARTYESFEVSEELEAELEEAGIEIAELQNPNPTAWFIDVSTPLYAQKFRNKVKRLGQQHRIERHNQYLPLSVTRLSNFEVQELLHATMNSDIRSRREVALSLIILIMLLTSSTFDRAKRVYVTKNSDNLDVDQMGDNIALCLSRKAWVVPRLELPFKTPEISNSKSTTPRTLLRFPVLLGFIVEVINLSFVDQHAELFQPFLKLKVSMGDVQEFLGSVSNRITSAKVTNYLISAAASRFGVSVAGYIFARTLPGSLARYYYSAHPLDHYTKLYLELAEAELSLKATFQDSINAHSCEPLDSLEYDFDLTKPEESFGARYVPDTKGLYRTIAALQNELNTLRRATTKYAFIEFHNLYTVYSIFAQSLLTGIRSVIDPFVGRENILAESDILVFRDKDTEDQFHTRMQPTHPLTLVLADNYRMHSSSVRDKLFFLNPKSFDSDKYGQSKTFFIDPVTHKILSSRPSIIGQFLKPFNTLPLNSNRKYLRSFLERERVSAESVDIMLGHYSLGESVGDRMSTFSLADVRREVMPAIDKLIQSLSIEPIAGLNV
ncbi:hypothetical protein FM042_07955 [Aliidiomarina halalkaliphila]|uniref:Uncharacterized protein n=1 Tax=Aliidiomarina halalkaliphila TaxID=2593535 RepID=A0A552X1K3_9GAMM|nr:hypothetical protein [Aliidiomarina halalkaliphila]TRW48907.1 hypothetical protein FM042_07955 [Aliidiomarina halalkaliphila]